MRRSAAVMVVGVAVAVVLHSDGTVRAQEALEPLFQESFEEGRSHWGTAELHDPSFFRLTKPGNRALVGHRTLLHYYDLESRRLLRRIPATWPRVFLDVFLTPDGSYLIAVTGAAPAYRPEVTVLDLSNGERNNLGDLDALESWTPLAPTALWSMSVQKPSRQGNFVLRLLEITGGQLMERAGTIRREVVHDSVEAGLEASDGTRLRWGGGDWLTRVELPGKGSTRFPLIPRPDLKMLRESELLISEDGQAVVAGIWEDKVRVNDLLRDELILSVPGVSFLADEQRQRILVWDGDREARLYSWKDRAFKQSFPGDSAVMAMSSDGAWVALGSRDGVRASVFAADEGELSQEFSWPGTSADGSGLTGIAFSPDGRKVALSGSGANSLPARVHRVEDGAELSRIPGAKTPLIFLSQGESVLCSGYRDRNRGELFTWNLASGAMERQSGDIELAAYEIEFLSYHEQKHVAYLSQATAGMVAVPLLRRGERAESRALHRRVKGERIRWSQKGISTCLPSGELVFLPHHATYSKVRIFPLSDGRNVMITEDGIYSGRGDSLRTVAVRHRGRVWGLEQLPAHHRLPGELVSSFGASRRMAEELSAFQSSDLVEPLPGLDSLPELELLEREKLPRTTSGETLSVSFWASGNEVPLEALRVFVNERPLVVGSQVLTEGSLQIPLERGENRIRLVVIDRLGRQSLAEMVDIWRRSEAPGLPRLFLLRLEPERPEAVLETASALRQKLLPRCRGLMERSWSPQRLLADEAQELIASFSTGNREDVILAVGEAGDFNELKELAESLKRVTHEVAPRLRFLLLQVKTEESSGKKLGNLEGVFNHWADWFPRQSGFQVIWVEKEAVSREAFLEIAGGAMIEAEDDMAFASWWRDTAQAWQTWRNHQATPRDLPDDAAEPLAEKEARLLARDWSVVEQVPRNRGSWRIEWKLSLTPQSGDRVRGRGNKFRVNGKPATYGERNTWIDLQLQLQGRQATGEGVETNWKGKRFPSRWEIEFAEDFASFQGRLLTPKGGFAAELKGKALVDREAGAEPGEGVSTR